MKAIRIGLIGDRDESVLAHRMIPPALALAAAAVRIPVDHEWVATDTIESPSRVSGFDALWCVPASPYRSMDGALTAISFARENAMPFLGTCGGFQHAVIEFARNVLGWRDADHAETSPDAARPVISELACALVEASETVRLGAGTRIAQAYGTLEATEGYRCRYGLNPEFEAELTKGPLRAAATDDTGAIRAVELDGHPFFVATLFQPERGAASGIAPPLAVALVRAAARM
jgi:CTP synthase (UTP-ammonia lyase)